MSSLLGPEPNAPVTYRKGSVGFGVAAVEMNLGLAVTGTFDAVVDAAVRKYQTRHGLAVDGDVGPITQRSMAAQFMGSARNKYGLPVNMLASIVKLESGFYVAATNFRISGYVDVGWVQMHVPFPSLTHDYVADCYGPNCFGYTASILRNRFDAYMGYGKVDARRGWELAVLAHNWPYGAFQLVRGIPLSTEPANWVINIGVPGIDTPAEWAEYYIDRATSMMDWKDV